MSVNRSFSSDMSRRGRDGSSAEVFRPRRAALVMVASGLFAASCVPRERPEKKATSEAPATVPAPASAEKSAVPAPPVSADQSTDPALEGPFTDDFERADLGTHWRATSPAWKVSNGRLCVQGARNHPIWLARRLPTNAIIEFQATSESADGDIKAELWGDGRSSASGQSYTDATSYLAIFGGWQNKLHVLARIDEHAPDRKEIKLVPEGADFTRSTVVPQQAYQFRVERRDGHTVRWLVNDVEILTYEDDEPLAGEGHEHFGFNDWEARVCFDNLRVTPLQD